MKNVNDEERVIGAESSDEDEAVELSLRPQYLAQYIGHATKSPAFSIAGPDVLFKWTPISFAITKAKVVLPKPGGP